jgi:hypothetical protein
MIGVALLLGALLGEPATSTRAQAAECVAVSILGLASGLALASSKDRGCMRGLPAAKACLNWYYSMNISTAGSSSIAVI